MKNQSFLLAVCLFVIAGSAHPALAEPMKSREDAFKLITAYLYHKVSGLSPDQTFEEITPKDGYAKTGVQVFKTSDYSSFAIRGKKVFPLGMSFGGYGINSMCVADLNEDQHPLLVFASSWGSGLHRTELGAFDPVTGKEFGAGMSYYQMDDLTVSSSDGHTVDVTARDKPVATLKMAQVNGSHKLRLILNSDAPEWAKQSFK